MTSQNDRPDATRAQVVTAANKETRHLVLAYLAEVFEPTAELIAGSHADRIPLRFGDSNGVRGSFDIPTSASLPEFEIVGRVARGETSVDVRIEQKAKGDLRATLVHFSSVDATKVGKPTAAPVLTTKFLIEALLTIEGFLFGGTLEPEIRREYLIDAVMFLTLERQVFPPRGNTEMPIDLDRVFALMTAPTNGAAAAAMDGEAARAWESTRSAPKHIRLAVGQK